MCALHGGTDMDEFKWEDLGDVQRGRQNLGEMMPVQMNRLFQFTLKQELVHQLGKQKTKALFQGAGKVAGVSFARHMLDLTLSQNDFLAQLKGALYEQKIGILRVESFDLEKDEVVLTISEDIDCSGLSVTNETVCNYDEGFLSGILNTYTNKEFVVIEKDCWATGSQVCRFEAHAL